MDVPVPDLVWSPAQLPLIFENLKEHKPPQSQDAADALTCAGLLSNFIQRHADLASHPNLLGSITKPSELIFCPAYGCAMFLLVNHGCAAEQTVFIHLIGLDNWSFYLLPQSTDTALPAQTAFTSAARTYAPLCGGKLPLGQLARFWDAFAECLERAQKRKGDQRNAGTNEQGHQKTPAFIEAIVQDALAVALTPPDASEPAPPAHPARGGFTDVGLHTGGLPRNTAWPLARAAIQFLLEQSAEIAFDADEPSAVMRRLIVDFKFALLASHLSAIEATLTTPTAAKIPYSSTDTLMHMLDGIVCEAIEYPAREHVAARAQAVRTRIEALAKASATGLVAQFTLADTKYFPRDAAKDETGLPFYVHPRLTLPPPLAPETNAVDAIDAARSRALTNSGAKGLVLSDVNTALHSLPATELHKRLQFEANAVSHLSHLTQLEAMHSVECWFYAVATYMRGKGAAEELAAVIDGLVPLVEQYRLLVAAFLASEKRHALLREEVMSRETLVVWIAYCLADRHASHRHPILRQYHASLRPEDLRHLVLSDMTALNALLAVANYLRDRTGSSPVFSGHTNDVTLRLAEEYAVNNPTMLARLEAETAVARQREAKHWAKAQEWKAALQEARAGYAEAQQRVEEQRALISKTPLTTRNMHKTLQELTRTAAAWAQTVRDKSIVREPLFQALAKSRQLALTTIFFANIPPALATLHRLSFMAQQMLVPRINGSLPQGIRAVPVKTNLESDYSSRSELDPDKTKPNARLWSPVARPSPEMVQPRLVDELSETNLNVHYPDDIMQQAQLAWFGGGFALDSELKDGSPVRLNPFLVTEEESAAKFAAELPERDTHLAFAFKQCVSAQVPATRSNEPIADQKPTCLTKFSAPQYLAFASLRAYPNLQIRKIAVAIRQRSLPFDLPLVQLLLRTALYHVGELSKVVGEVTFPIWKYDLVIADGLPVLYEELTCLADELSEKPREHQMLLAVIDAAVYLRGWDTRPERDALRRKCADIACKWARRIDDELARLSGSSAASARATQCLFYMYALLTLGGAHDLDEADAASLCELRVRAHQGLVDEVHCPDDDDTKSLFRRLALRVDGVVSARLRWLLSVLRSRGHYLTAAVRAIVHTAPNAMEWRPYRTVPPTALFDAVCDNHLYTINLHTGAVLVDGLPPCTLPDEIRKHPVYVRSFDDRDFRVVPKGGILESTVVHDIYYEFYFSPATKRLLVWEINKPTGERLELLDGTNVAAWCAALPARLTELHSHWLSRARHCILLRPRHFEHRTVDFVLLLAGEPRAAPAPCECVRVPAYRSDSPWIEIATLARAHNEPFTDLLVVWPKQPPLLATLAKFEDARFIHTYVATAAADREIKLKIEFPRFRMEFEVVRTHADCYEVLSTDYRGYRLCRGQQLTDTLCGFTTYLLLEQIRDRNDLKMLVPAGNVVPMTLGADRSAALAIDAKCEAELSCRTYYVHQRYNELRTCGADLAARLQLAALYAATSTALPEPMRKMTGVEVAIELVRQCFVNRPLDAQEREQLGGVEQFSFKSPALYLACRHLAYTSEQMGFLYPTAPTPDAPVAKSAPLPSSTEHDCITEYQLYCTRAPPNPRLLLSAEEEARITGIRMRHRTLQNASLPPWTLSSSLLRLRSLPGAADLVRNTEDQLAAFVVEQPAAPQAASVASPVATDAAAGALEREMKRELEESWRVYQQQPTRRISVAPEALRATVAGLLAKVRANRGLVETYALEAVRSEPPDSTYAPYVYARRLLCAANRVPQPSMRDVVQSLWLPSRLTDLNFFLSLCPADCSTVRSAALRWLELCVLEDKLARIMQKLDEHAAATPKPAPVPDVATAPVPLAPPSAPYVLPALSARPPPPPADVWPPALLSDMLKELTCRREWSAAYHPMWLAFEADSRLQIRPLQYRVASQLDSNPRAVVQLNMGEGKTRVILPMLVLRWISDRRHVVRLHLLGELLSEGFDFLHEHLCAGTLNRKIFLMPFNRDVALTADRLRAMREHVAYCRREGGVVLLTPESRCSLQLKLQELYADESVRDVCEAIAAYEALPWRDVFDESDELLRHKLQVIYAVGAPMRLPALEERCVAVQMALQALESPALKTLLKDNRIAVCHDAASPEGFYTTVRLLPGEPLDEAMSRLTTAVAEAVLSAPPYEMSWLRRFGRAKDVLRYVTDKSAPADAIIPRADFAQSRHRDALLALRGFLVHGLLQSCLTHRHRVTYGLRDPRGVALAAPQAAAATKRLAVPYRACDVPSERCEFAHPDTAILLTHLAYLYDGLTEQQVLQAVKALLECGSIEQREVYNLWLARSRQMKSLSSEEITSIDSPDKIDRSNIEQRKLLYRAFSRNVQTVFFWLSNVALPDDTKQYAHRIKASAWHVAHHGERCPPVGFSGTNDSHRLLPLHVAQHPVAEAELRATNGRMLDLLRHQSTYELLPRSAAAPAWQQLLEFAVLTRRASALIDSGALLAGISGAQCAEFVVRLLHRLPAPAPGAAALQAVVYFDQNKWYVRNRVGRVWPKASAPVAERDAFVLFDQQHCRGADMRLRPDAEAVLTLGPGLCKDKLMQAAGRLRLLGRMQTLRVVAQSDVDDSIRRLAKAEPHAAVTPAQVLQWVMANTVRATEDGLLEWAGNGLHFLHTRDHPERSRLPEVLHLNELYQAAVRMDTIDNNVARLIKERVPSVAQSDLEYLNRIRSRTAEFGTREIVASVAEEECERELEQETEREEQQERQLSKQQACPEADWDYETALKGWAALPKSAYNTLASAIAANVLKVPLNLIGWNGAAGCVYATHNFFNTVVRTSGGGTVCLGDYLRPLDVFLYFRKEGVALLVSDREANALLPRFWQLHKSNKAAADSTAVPVSFVHLSYARDAQTPATRLSLPSGVPLATASLLPPLVRMQLFNGDTTFARPGSEALVASQLLATPAAKSAALLLPRLRGYAHTVARSHLERLCDAEGAHTAL